MKLQLLRRSAFTTAFVCALNGCTVGPRYHGAPAAAPVAARAATFARPSEGVSMNAPAPDSWWTRLDDPQLSTLIESALARDTDVRAAQARLRQSRAALREKRRDALPKAAAAAAFVHTGAPDSSLGIGNYDFYDASVDATWEIDLFGGTRRAVEAAAAAADATAADLDDVHVQIAAEVALRYVELRDLQQRIALVRQSADLEQQILSLTQQRRSRGVASELDVERIRTQVEETRTSEIPLDAQIIEALDRLAGLTAHEPGTLDAELGSSRPLPSLPAMIAIGDPAALLRHRPDIRAAERRLASKNAEIGQREADWFPKLTLFGDLGFSATQPDHLLRSSSFTWFAVPYLQWNALDFGRTRAKVEQAKGGFEEAEANYEGTVLGALQDADIALSRYGHQRSSVVSLRIVEDSASRTAFLTQQRYRAGVTSALDWLDAERTRFSAQQNRVAGEAELLRDYVALEKSLGLGWKNTG